MTTGGPSIQSFGPTREEGTRNNPLVPRSGAAAYRETGRSGPRRRLRLAIVFGLITALAACAPSVIESGPDTAQPRIERLTLRAADGAALPMQRWLPNGVRLKRGQRLHTVIVAVHGMNDYANSFDGPGRYWAKRGIATYAFDQRGFGRAPGRGLWPGVARMQSDFRAAVAAVRRRYPGAKIYGLGMSMGGGVVLSAMGRPDAPKLDGMILVAPAVWSRATMPGLYRATLSLAAHTIPWARLSPSAVKRLPTDNVALLKRLGKDKHMLRGARVEAIWGVVNLMDAAAAAAPRARVPTLLLYGERDEIVPRKPIRAVIARLPRPRTKVAVYAEGWHMLLRDRQASVVLNDIAVWLRNPRAALPSGADRRDVAAILKKPRPKRPRAIQRWLLGQP